MRVGPGQKVTVKKITHSQCSRVIDNQIMQRVEEHESVVLQSSELCLI